MAVKTEQYKGYEITITETGMSTGYNWRVDEYEDGERNTLMASDAQVQFHGQNYGYKTPEQAIGAAKRSINDMLSKMAGHTPR